MFTPETLEPLAQKLIIVEKEVRLAIPDNEEESEEKEQLLELISLHQKTLLELLSPEGKNLLEADPAYREKFMLWEKECSRFVEEIHEAANQE